MSFSQKVKSALWNIVNDMDSHRSDFVKNPGKDFSRERKFNFVQFIRFCVCMQSGCLNHELLKYFFFNSLCTPSSSAFIQRRAKLIPHAFRYLLGQFNLRFPLRKFMGKYYLIAADGCEFNISRDPNDPSTFHPASGKSKKGSILSIPSPLRSGLKTVSGCYRPTRPTKK